MLRSEMPRQVGPPCVVCGEPSQCPIWESPMCMQHVGLWFQNAPAGCAEFERLAGPDDFGEPYPLSGYRPLKDEFRQKCYREFTAEFVRRMRTEKRGAA